MKHSTRNENCPMCRKPLREQEETDDEIRQLQMEEAFADADYDDDITDDDITDDDNEEITIGRIDGDVYYFPSAIETPEQCVEVISNVYGNLNKYGCNNSIYYAIVKIMNPEYNWVDSEESRNADDCIEAIDNITEIYKKTQRIKTHLLEKYHLHQREQN
jgi:hypothetical protein